MFNTEPVEASSASLPLLAAPEPVEDIQSEQDADFTQEFIEVVNDIYLNVDFEDTTFNYFENKINQIRQNNEVDYNQYLDHINLLNKDLAEIQQLEKNLIEKHMNAGEHLCALQDWFVEHFDTDRGWEEFVLSKIDFEYSIRTSQRDMMCWRRLAPYKDLLIRAGNSKLAISTVYFLANPEKTSDMALDWAISLIEKHAGIAQSQESSSTYNRLTSTKAKEIAETADFIENKIDEEKREILQQIAITHNVSNLSLIKELSNESVETLNEIQETGHIEYLIDTNTGSVQRNIPVAEASVTDIELKRDSEEFEKDQRFILHKREGVKERERREHGTESEFMQAIMLPELNKDICEDLVQFLKSNYDNKDISHLTQIFDAIRFAQGDAGTKLLVYRVSYANTDNQGVADFSSFSNNQPDEDQSDINHFAF